MIKRMVCVLDNEIKVNNIRQNLLDHNMADFRIVQLGDEYEQAVRQEIFLTFWEYKVTIMGGLMGSIIGAILLTVLALSSEYAFLLGRVMASGLYSATFVGAGIGFALGGLLAGLYAFSKSLPGNYNGYWLLVLFCHEKGQKDLAGKIINREQGITIGH